MSHEASIEEKDVRHVARLARLTLSDDEVQTLARDLGDILKYVRKLEELDTSEVLPTAHAVELPTRLREDTVGLGLSLELGLRDAPERVGDGFGVPKIID
jgi:aspartyl-tRNA(Asn)/glutamyl-tRNA(Gln) amidotransferase subunit C